MRMPQRANENWQRYCRPMLHSELFLQGKIGSRSQNYVAPNDKETKDRATKDPAKTEGSVKEDYFVWGMASSLGLWRKRFRGGREWLPVERRRIGAARAAEERDEERMRRRRVRLFKTLKSIKGNCSS